MKLPTEFKTNWISALRSGKYQQGTGLLYDKLSDKYCCLGVACRVAGLHEDSIDDVGMIAYELRDIDLSSVPEILQGVPSDNDLVAQLTGMNDDNRQSFESIADWIDRNL